MAASREEIKEIIGCDYRVEQLKSQELIRINQKRVPFKKQLSVELLITEDGRKFKLHEVDVPENVHINRIRDMFPLFQTMDFVPEIIHDDELKIIVEYIDGVFPDITSDEFTRLYAKNLAQVHNTDFSYKETGTVMAGLQEDIDFLVGRRRLNKKEGRTATGMLGQLRPEKIHASMIYADLTSQNFVITPENKMFFIDLGSFQRDQLTDQFLLTSTLYQNLNQELFKEVYLENGGNDYLFKNSQFLFISSKVARTALLIRSMKTIPFKLWIKRRSRKKLIARLVDELKQLVSNS